MNAFERLIILLQGEMETPVSFGWFHVMWLILSLLMIVYFYLTKRKNSDKRTKRILLTYGCISFLLELIKQIIWSYDAGVWDYQWYAFPFQFCTTPLIISIIYYFVNNEKIKESLLSYLGFYTILGGIATMIMPDSCFTSTIEVNIYTMFLHCGSFVISYYILMSDNLKISWHNLINGFKVALMFIAIAFSLNLIIYNSGILHGETFNMFYISPYFISALPVFNVLQERLPYVIFLALYILAIFLGGLIIFGITKLVKKLKKK